MRRPQHRDTDGFVAVIKLSKKKKKIEKAAFDGWRERCF